MVLLEYMLNMQKKVFLVLICLLAPATVWSQNSMHEDNTHVDTFYLENHCTDTLYVATSGNIDTICIDTICIDTLYFDSPNIDALNHETPNVEPDDQSEQSLRYLTFEQADTVLSVIGNYSEIVLYCGNEREVETYMVLCDYWTEWIASPEEMALYDSLYNTGIAIDVDAWSDQYEIWVLGYDLHTGDTICTPIEPSCLWIHKNGVTYNVGNYVSLDSVIKLFPFKWKVPKYSLISCLEYDEKIQPTYHYDIHVFGYYSPVVHRPLPPSYYKSVKTISPEQVSRMRTQPARKRTTFSRMASGQRGLSSRNSADGGRNNGNGSVSGRGGNNGGSSNSGNNNRGRSDANQSQQTGQERQRNDNKGRTVVQENKKQSERERQQEQLKIQRQQQEDAKKRQEEQLRMQEEQQRRLKNQQEEQMRKQQAEQQRRQQAERARKQQEEQQKKQQAEQARRQAELQKQKQQEEKSGQPQPKQPKKTTRLKSR